MSAHKTPRRNRPLALAYLRVSTFEQVAEGASLDAQRSLLESEAQRRGWDVHLVRDEGFSAATVKRPGLTGALDRLDTGGADVLMAVRLDHLSRSVADFSTLLSRARRRGWRLVLISPDIDTDDPAGKFTAHVLAAAAEYERDLIAARTREGMAQRRLEGQHLGRPRVVSELVIARVVQERAAGATLRQIASGLTRDRVPTARGGSQWRTSSVQGLLVSLTGRQMASDLEDDNST